MSGFPTQGGHVDHEHLGRGEAQQRIRAIIIIGANGTHAAVDRFSRQVQVLAHMPGIQVQVAVTAFGIAPHSAVGDSSPDEGDRAGGHLALPQADLGQLCVEVRILAQGNQLMGAAHKAVQPGSSPSTRLTDR
jgi:hypothetical protein